MDQLAGLIRLIQIDGWRQEAATDGSQTGDCLEGRRGTDQVAGHAFG